MATHDAGPATPPSGARAADRVSRDDLLARLLAEESESSDSMFSGPRRSTASSSTHPTSFAQERLWFVDQVTGDGGAFNIPHALRLRGSVDAEALAWALDQVVRRHEALRTTFPTVDGRPVQQVHPHTGLVLARRDLTQAADPEAALAEHASIEAMVPFDLATGPLLRAELVRLGDADHVLLLTVHHIVSDGWSSGVLVREMAAFYVAHRRSGGRAIADSILPPLPIQYSDFARWQRGQSPTEHETQLAYWAGVLQSIQPMHLPIDRPRPRTMLGLGDTVRFEVPGAVRDRLRTLAVSERASLFMGLSAAFGLVLHRLSGQTDVVMGTQIANRQQPELEPLVGFFVNTLVLRTDVGGDPTFRELLRRHREVCLRAYDNQDVSFERVVEAVQPDRSRSQLLPLFNVDCMLQNAPQSAFDLDDVSVEVLDRHTWTTKADLGMVFWEGVDGDGLVGWCEFSTEMFDRATAERLSANLLRVLDVVSAAPDVPLSALGDMRPEEREVQVGTWQVPVVAPRPDMTVREVFAEAVRRRSDELALAGATGTLTFAELDQRSNHVAWRLVDLGIGPEARVCVVGSRDVDTIVGILGVLRSGAAFVTVDPAASDVRWKAVLAAADPRAIVCVEGSAPPDVEGLPPVVVVDGGTAMASPPVVPDAQQLAYIMFTSGSTGRPKGVMVEHGSLVNLVRWLGESVHRAEDQPRRGCFNPDLTSDAFIEDLALLLRGETMYVPDSATRRDPRLLAEFLREHDIDCFGTTPTQLAQLQEWSLLKTSGIRSMIVGSEAFPQNLWDAAAASDIEVWNVYGPTECTVDAVASRVRPGVEPVIGSSLPSVVSRVVDTSLSLLPTGSRGELCVGGVATGRGYLGDPRQTAEMFVPDPWSNVPGARMYRTGDVVSYRPDGSLRFHGRRDDQVKIRGYRVELGEVAAALRRHPGVTDVHLELDGEPGPAQQLVAYVAADLSTADGSVARHQVEEWQRIFDTEQAEDAVDVSFNTAGWKDTATLTRIPDHEMVEFRDAAVRRVLAQRPREVLELGCGTGLILYGLAPHLDRYVGVDLSPVTIERLRDTVMAAPPGPEVQLFVGEAAEPPVDDVVDTVILNSVVQYFPSSDYLERTLRAVAARTTPDGSVFLGDLRSPRLLWMTCAWVELSRARPSDRLGDVSVRIAVAEQRDRELLVAPEFVADVAEVALPGSWTEALVHEGSGDNELVRFRYDVVVHRAAPDHEVEPRWLDGAGTLDVDQVAQVLENPPADCVGWHGVPNRRVWRERALAQALALGLDDLLVSQVPLNDVPEGIDVQVLVDSAAAAGHDVKVFFSPGRDDGALDIVVLPLRLRGATVRVVPPSQTEHDTGTESPTTAVSSPQVVHRRLTFQLEVRQAAARHLPEHMVPSRFVVLDRLPVNAAGKVDRAALPDPALGRRSADSAAAALRGLYELTVGRVWCDLLQVPGVSADDDFFVLGGHSLLAASLVNRLNEELSTDLTIRDVFDHPVLRSMAAAVEDAANGPRGVPLLPTLRDEWMPLSGAQERMLAAETLGSVPPGSYNMHHCLRIDGPLDVRAMELAVADLIERHEVLRTRFRVTAGVAQQQVLPTGPVLEPVDVSGDPSPEAAVAALVASEVVRPFDLTAAPPVRLRIVRLGDEQHLLLLVVHHIASDGWSTAVALRELVDGYARHTADVPVPRPPRLPIQYVDYAVWHREWSEARIESELAFWRQCLDGARAARPPGLRATPGPQPAGETFLFELAPDVVAGLDRLAVREGVTLFMAVLAAFGAALSQATRQTDLVVGTLVAGRRRAALEQLVGFFVNPLAVRIDAAAPSTYRELLHGVRRATLAAYAHQDAPFDRVAREVAPVADRPGEPVFDILLQVDDASPDLPPTLGAARLSDHPVIKHTARYPMALFISRRPGMSCSVEYRTDLLDDEEVRAFVDQFVDVLTKVASAPDEPLELLLETQ